MTKTRVAPMIFAGAAAVAALTVFNAAPPADTATPVASGPAAAMGPFATDDPNFVNDQGQTPGDTFTQNAQDQSTASGAGT